MEIRHLRAFTTIARVGNFTRAARLLHLSQPALSVQVRQLEHDIGGRLFDRTTRSVRLTGLGRELADKLLHALAELDDAVLSAREWSAGTRGSLVVACLPSVAATLVPTTIARFTAVYPGVRVRVRDVVGQQVLELVRSGDVDVGIAAVDGQQPGLDVDSLMVDGMSAVFRADHELARMRTITLGRLRAFPLLVSDTRSSARALIDRAFEGIGVLTAPAYEVTYIPTILAMARAGLGVGIVPSTMLHARDREGLAWRRIKDPALVRRICVVRAAGRTPSTAAARFVEALHAASASC